jgi:hypothetical protein
MQEGGYTLNRDNTLPPSSTNSCLDEYHYQLLLDTDCVQEELEAAWEAWKELGKYEHGELYRRTLFETAKCLNPHLALWNEITVGMNGPSDESAKFYTKWTAKARKEARRDKHWEMWKEAEAMRDFRVAIVGCHKEGCKHYGECLGKMIYD